MKPDTLLIQAMTESSTSNCKLSDETSISRSTIGRIKKGQDIGIRKFERMLDVMGYELTVKKREQE